MNNTKVFLHHFCVAKCTAIRTLMDGDWEEDITTKHSVFPDGLFSAVNNFETEKQDQIRRLEEYNQKVVQKRAEDVRRMLEQPDYIAMDVIRTRYEGRAEQLADIMHEGYVHWTDQFKEE